VALVRELALLESPSGLPEAQKPVFDRLAAALEDAGLRTRRLAGDTSGGQLYAALPRPRPAGSQLLVGHCDTVWPVGTLAGMPVELAGDIHQREQRRSDHEGGRERRAERGCCDQSDDPSCGPGAGRQIDRHEPV